MKATGVNSELNLPLAGIPVKRNQGKDKKMHCSPCLRFVREGLVGFLLLCLLGLSWPFALGSGIALAVVAVLVRMLISLFSGDGNRRWYSTLSHGFLALGALFGVAVWTVYYIRGAQDVLAARDTLLGPEAILIFVVGAGIAALLGIFIGSMLNVVLGPIVSLPYRMISSLFRRKKTKSNAGGSRDPRTTEGRSVEIVHHSSTVQSPPSGDSGSSLTF